MRGNSVSIKGNVTRDAETRRAGESNVVKFGIAWNSSKRNASGGWDDIPNFFDVECWMSDKQLAMFDGQIVKGARCAIIDGQLAYDSWENNGERRSKVYIKVNDPVSGLLFSAPQGRQGGYQQTAQQPPQDPADALFEADDIPW